VLESWTLKVVRSRYQPISIENQLSIEAVPQQEPLAEKVIISNGDSCFAQVFPSNPNKTDIANKKEMNG
jgi:hypothetical protein